MGQDDFLEFYKTIRPTAPNELQVIVVKAEKLRAADGTTFGAGTSDPFVELKIGKLKQKTKVIKKDLNPFWNEKFSFRVVEPQLALQVIISDYDLTGNDFLGRTTVSMKSLVMMAAGGGASEPEWFELRDSKGNKDTTTRGRVQLILKWRHNTDMKFKPFSLKEEDDESSDEDGEDEVDDGKGDDPEETQVEGSEEKAEAAEAAKEATDSLMKDQQGFKVISGDYQVHVHIIECRDLRPKDLNGMSDPFVTVEMFGKKQLTAVVSSTLNPVFDDLLIFNMKGLDKEEFEEALIKVTVKDSDLLTSNDMIGAYAFDATYVYFQKDHELHNSWVGLINEKDVNDEGCQGYLKLSVQIVGPNDKLKIHHEVEGPADTDDQDIGSMVLMPPTIKKEQKWLVVTAHCGEYLPALDKAVSVGGLDLSSAGIDAFYRAEFSDSKISSKVVTVKGKSRHMLNPEWHWELWLPVLTPTATSRVKHSIWDYDMLDGNDIAGMFYSTFKETEKKKKVGPRWVNLMGAPTVATSTSETLKVAASGGTDWRAKYNAHPDLASTYRGRVLITEKVRPTLPKREIAKDRPFKAWKRKVKALDVMKYPQTNKYVLKAGVISGSELPQISGGVVDGGRNRKMGVKITCGKFEIITTRTANNKGCCEWAVSDSVDMELPRHDVYPEQLPDVCIYLYTGKTAADMIPMCYTRVKAMDLISEKFAGEFKWHTMQEDKALNKLPDKMFPGCLLIRLGLGTAEVAAETADEWSRMTSPESLSVKVPYIVRVNIFQCRSLPAADADGMIDPYLKVNVLGSVQATRKKQNTKDPMFYQTFDFKCEINPAFGLQLAPRVCIQVWDSDWGFGSESDDYCGCCMLDLKEAFVDASSAMDEYTLDSKVTESLPDDLPPSVTVLHPKSRLEGKEFPDPKWVDFMIEKEGDGEGSLLASVQLIPSSPGHAITPPMPNILPDTIEAFLEITTLGCRNLIPYNFLPITLPRLEFVLELADETIKQSSPDSKKPSPQNPNYLRYDIIPVARFPHKSIFAPRLKIRAFDTRLGGLSKPNIGNCSVALETKMPWDPAYIAHESHFAVPPPPVLPIFDAEETKEEGDGFDDEEDESDLRDGVGGDEGFDEDGEGDEEEFKEGDLVNTMANEVALEEPVASFKERLADMAGDEDTGAGVFGALKHLEAELAKEDALLDAAFQIEQEEVDEPDKPPAYMIGRQRLDGTIEEELVTTPFETIQLELGQKGGGMFGGGDLRSVGCFKGLIRVLDHEPTKEEAPFDLQALLKPQSYKVRLYVLRAMALTPMDPGWMGRPGKSDPYLRVELGKDTFNGREDFVEDATDVDFYTCIELNAELPGAGQMVLKVMDADTFGSDDMIGRTVVDLEDRWFDERWQLLGSDLESKDPEKLRWKVKPIETRELYQPPEGRGAIAQGRLETWVDIMLPAEATAYPADDVALPPEAVFEVRLIVWKAKDVVSMDSLSNMNDTYVKAFIEGTDSQSTDIHWRAKKGKASWNYRLKFDVNLGHNTRTMKFPYLNLSMWDKDILKYDDVIAETVLDLGKYLKRAYKKNMTVKLFDDAKKNRKRSKAKTDAPPQPTEEDNELSKEWEFEEQPEEQPPQEEEAAAAAEVAATPSEVTPPEKSAPPADASLFDTASEPAATEDDLIKDSSTPPQTDQNGAKGSSVAGKEVELTDVKKAQPAPDPTVLSTVSPMHVEPTGKKEAVDSKTKTKKKEESAGEAKQQKKAGGGWCGRKKAVESDDEDAPLLDAEAQEKAEDDKEATQAVSMIRGLFGLGEDDPPDSTWLHMTIKDFKNDTRIPMGKLCISISILPKAEAKINDNGFGRREPNHSPLLPPPVGRLKWSWNPFVMGSQLCGPALCFYFTCCLIVSIVIVLMIFCQPAMNLIISVCVKLFL
jgi:hypothetical protein